MDERRGSGGKPLSLHFGQIAVRHGYISRGGLRRCLAIQKEIVDSGGEPVKLGEIMIREGFISAEDAREIFFLQGREGGHTVIEGYEVGDLLGQGGMGTVYRAVQLPLRRTVAIKILLPEFAKDRKYVLRFLREARASAWLNHQNIISGIDVGESNGLYYFAMEYVDGPTVQQLLDSGGALPERQALDIALQMARALEHAWQVGIVHRDVKPDNIMIASDGTAKLLDLGIARQERSIGERTVVGTPEYLSPEQARGDANIDIRSDIYSLGVTLYHMVTGRRPFDGTPEILLRRHLQSSPPSPRTFAPLSEGCVRLIQRMMAKDRDHRPADPRELAIAIDSALAVESVRTTDFEELTPPPGFEHGGITAVPVVAPLVERAPVRSSPSKRKRRPRRGSYSRRRRR